MGIVAALGLTRFMQSLLFEMHHADPLTFTASPSSLGGVALLAGYIPARRAARIDPVVSLRSRLAPRQPGT